MSQANCCVNDPENLLRIQTKIKKTVVGARSLEELYAQLVEACINLPSIDCAWIWTRGSSKDGLVLENSQGADQNVQKTLSHMYGHQSVVNHLLVGNDVIQEWEQIWGDQSQVFLSAGLNQVAALPVEVTEGQTIILGFASRQKDPFETCLLNVMRLAALDLAQRHQVLDLELSMHGARENFGQIISALDGFIFVVDPKGEILHSNLSEYNSDTSRPKIDSILPDGTRLIQQQNVDWPKIRPQDELVPNHCRLRVENNRLLPVEVKVRAIQWDHRKAFLISCRDITQQLVIEKERNRLVTAIEQTADGIIITDSSGDIQYTNPAFSRMTGYSESDVLGQNPRILKSNRHDEKYYAQMWSTVRRGETWQGRMANLNKDGEEYWQVATISPVLDTSGIITHFVGVQRDITNEMKLEERLRQSQKLEAIGTLAGGIAHDFNNILYALLGNSQLALDDIPSEHPAYIPMTEIVKAGERGSELVAKMLAFGQRSEKKRVKKSLQPIVREVMELVRASLPTSISIELDLADDCPKAWLDEAQIHQAVLNLCTNAAHAMGDTGGVLNLCLQPKTVLDDTPEVLSGVIPGDYLLLRVSDTGRGMDETVLSRIFEPYYTTKQSDEGTGLGLASVHGIVSNHEGIILVESTLGKGSTFTLYFPAAPVEGLVNEEKGQIENRIEGHGRVMVVDDEPMITDLMKRGLEKLGFEVTGFTDGVEALKFFGEDPSAFDVVVTDQTMPKITGHELAFQLSSMRPDLPIILSTGYSETVSQNEMKSLGISYSLPKPLRTRDLAALLCEITEPLGSLKEV